MTKQLISELERVAKNHQMLFQCILDLESYVKAWNAGERAESVMITIESRLKKVRRDLNAETTGNVR